MPKHVLIVGAGVIGLCTAYSLSQRGIQVTILDRNGPDHLNCSFGNAGMIVPSHFVPLAAPGMVRTALRMMLRPRSPFYIRPRLSLDLLDWGWKFYQSANAPHVARSAPLLRDLHLASRKLYEDLSRLPDFDFGLAQRGLLMLCKTQRALDEESHLAATARELGIPADVLDAKQTAALDPNVRMDVAGAVYFPKDCHLRPACLMNRLCVHLQKAGVTFEWNAKVMGWRLNAKRVEAACTQRGEFGADEFVLAGGSWSARIARQLKLKLPLQAGKGYSLTLKNPRRLPQICAIFTEARVAVTPMGDSLRFGGTMEMSGINDAIDHGRVRGIIESIPRYYPEFRQQDFAEVPIWHGLRPCSPDGLPYIGRPRAWDNLAIATGHAMMGVSLGPVTGELVAQTICGEKPATDILLLAPDRFASLRPA